LILIRLLAAEKISDAADPTNSNNPTRRQQKAKPAIPPQKPRTPKNTMLL